MRKIYSFLLLLVLAVGLSIQANAGVTVKTNKTGVLYFEPMGSSDQIYLNSEVNTLPQTGDMTLGTLWCPATHTMTVTNETTGRAVTPSEYDGMLKIDINPGTAPDGTVFNITVTAVGGGGEDPEDKVITFVFNPEESGYIVTTHADDSGATVEDDTYRPEDGIVTVPYTTDGSYIIKPNPGFALLNAKDETETNPHYTGDAPSGNGWIYGMMTSTKPGATIAVTATRNGSFTVKGIGDDISNIVMQNMTSYNYVTVTTDETPVNFTGGTQFKIYSNTSSPIWKVEVTDSEDYTTSLSGNYGNFFYTPNDGDKVAIYAQKPTMYCKFHITYEGEGVNKNIIKSVWYGNNEESEYTWANGEWTKEGEDYLRIFFNTTGFTNFSCKINGVSCGLTSDSQGNQYIGYQVNNGSTTFKEYNIVISAEKETFYNLTLNCDTPSAVSVATLTGHDINATLSFTQSGQTFKISKSNNKLKIQAQSGWLVDGILVDGELPKEGEFTDGVYFVNNDCTITINVSNKADKRTKTAVVYVDESNPNPMYLDFKYYDQTSVTLTPGYNFVPFGDDDLPFSFGYYAGSQGEFYVNGQKIDAPNQCPQTSDLEDGAVIKYFNGTPKAQIVSYNIDENIADAIEIYHDYTVGIDHKTTTEHACFTGTLIHIKPASQASQVKGLHRANAVALDVKVNGEPLKADEDGVYTIKVGDTAPVISVAKDDTTGIDGNFADENGLYDIYNLQGIVVKRNATAADVNALPAGIYIVNGNKLLKK